LHAPAAFTEDGETLQRCVFHLLCLLWLRGELGEALNPWNEMENRFIFHILHFSFADEELSHRIHFCDFGGRGRKNHLSSMKGTQFELA